MSLLQLILVVVLQIEGIRGETSFIYSRAGDAAIVSCGSNRTCSEVSWVYNRDLYQTFAEVASGKVKQSSSRAARLSLDASCSLVIKNITTEDFGRYSCQQGGNIDHDTYLSVLTVSRSPPYADQYGNGVVTLQCQLWRTDYLPPGQQISIRWVDDKGTVLSRSAQVWKTPNRPGNYMYSGHNVKLQSFYNSRYTCQVVDQRDKNNAKTEAAITGDTRDAQPETSDPGHTSDLTPVIVGAVVGVLLVLLAVITALLIRYRKRVKETADGWEPTQHPDEPESNLTYATVDHSAQQASPRTKAREEEERVTYSAVKTARTDADNDPSSIYSNITQPK